MSTTEKDRQVRPEAYPKPTESDQQLKKHPEYIDQQPNDFSDKTVSDLPAEAGTGRVASEPDTKERTP